MKRSYRAILATVLVAVGGAVLAQGRVAPVNDPANTYLAARDWGVLPDSRRWGAISGVDVDRDGTSLWVVDRCGGISCADSTIPPVVKLDGDGRLVTAFGAGLFAVPHGIDVDADGNVWVTDDSPTSVVGKGHQVIKFSPDGRVLMRLGVPGSPGNSNDKFNRPSDVVVAPTGDIFVADGHGGDSNARIVKYSRDGRFIKSWGMKGADRGQFDTPHGVTMDSQGRLFVADLRNFRLQLFDQEGGFIDAWEQFGMPGGVFIDANDRIYVADSLSSADTHPGWIRGIRIGNARDGRVTAFIPDATPVATPITAAEGVAADRLGNVFGAVVPTPGLKKYVPR